MSNFPSFFQTQKRRLIFCIIGVVLALTAFTADSSGLGTTRDFGLGQFTLVGLGIGLFSMGLFSRPDDLTTPRAFGKRMIQLYQNLAVLVLNTILMIFVLEFGSMIILRLTPVDNSPSAPRPFREWENLYWNEYHTATQKTQYYPYSIWRAMPFAGETIQIDPAGIRSTPGANCQTNSYLVFTFGGSTMWGQSVPDWETIPAHLQQGLESLVDQPVCTINFAQRGYVITQDYIELVGQLQAGNIPDLVIFFDGFNEVQAAFPEMKVPAPHIQQTQIDTRFEAPFLEWFQNTQVFRLSRRVIPLSLPTADPDRLSEQIIQTYLETFQMTKLLGEHYGFQVEFFWQPTVLIGNKPLIPFEAMIISQYPPEFDIALEKTYQVMEDTAETTENLTYLGDIFDQTEDWIYLDPVHINDLGNQMVAQAMLNTISPLILSK